MNILQRPELVDRLAAAYALGSLRGGARRRFEALARSSPTLRVAAQVWQERLMSITELQPPEQPGPHVWTRIENLVAAEARAPVTSPELDVLRRARRWWRAATAAAVFAGVGAVAVLVHLQSQPEMRYVAVLSDDKAQPAMLVSFDPRSRMLTVKRVMGYQEGPEKSLQLWALPAGGAPHSLGVISQQAVMRMPMADGMAGQAPLMAISLEPKGGVPGEKGPTGPVLWKGPVVQAPL